MNYLKIVHYTKKWLLRLVIAFMLGFANAIHMNVKSVDESLFKIEETDKKL
ncbi:hypothetical protein [Dyadobacter sediminis]|uniref:hypothetical protein n=1 Tax=Dyadobacter sediminis TaxID=1493691 RepID=UPI00166D312E|nr:hypothetical protein [Dyadobacter sediminis]GGC09884.1 hypothetical protein GCM10011325_40940 [Dyadobacter sediminis]